MSEKLHTGEIFKGISSDTIDAIRDYFFEIHGREPSADTDEVIQGSDTIFSLAGIPPEKFDEVMNSVTEILNDVEGPDAYNVAIGDNETDSSVLIISPR